MDRMIDVRNLEVLIRLLLIVPWPTLATAIDGERCNATLNGEYMSGDPFGRMEPGFGTTATYNATSRQLLVNIGGNVTMYCNGCEQLKTADGLMADKVTLYCRSVPNYSPPYLAYASGQKVLDAPMQGCAWGCSINSSYFMESPPQSAKFFTALGTYVNYTLNACEDSLVNLTCDAGSRFNTSSYTSTQTLRCSNGQLGLLGGTNVTLKSKVPACVYNCEWVFGNSLHYRPNITAKFSQTGRFTETALRTSESVTLTCGAGLHFLVKGLPFSSAKLDCVQINSTSMGNGSTSGSSYATYTFMYQQQLGYPDGCYWDCWMDVLNLFTHVTPTNSITSGHGLYNNQTFVLNLGLNATVSFVCPPDTAFLIDGQEMNTISLVCTQYKIFYGTGEINSSSKLTGCAPVATTTTATSTTNSTSSTSTTTVQTTTRKIMTTTTVYPSQTTLITNATSETTTMVTTTPASTASTTGGLVTNASETTAPTYAITTTFSPVTTTGAISTNFSAVTTIGAISTNLSAETTSGTISTSSTAATKATTTSSPSTSASSSQTASTNGSTTTITQTTAHSTVSTKASSTIYTLGSSTSTAPQTSGQGSSTNCAMGTATSASELQSATRSLNRTISATNTTDPAELEYRTDLIANYTSQLSDAISNPCVQMNYTYIASVKRYLLTALAQLNEQILYASKNSSDSITPDLMTGIASVCSELSLLRDVMLQSGDQNITAVAGDLMQAIDAQALLYQQVKPKG